jgi:hypothetical protein
MILVYFQRDVEQVSRSKNGGSVTASCPRGGAPLVRWEGEHTPAAARAADSTAASVIGHVRACGGARGERTRTRAAVAHALENIAHESGCRVAHESPRAEQYFPSPRTSSARGRAPALGVRLRVESGKSAPSI